MNRKEARTKIAAMLSAGSTKSDVFASLSGQGVEDRVLANLIASRPDPERCRRNKLHVCILVGLGILQLLFSLWVAVTLATDAATIGPVTSSDWAVIGLFLAITVPISLLFTWGFATHRVGAYHAYIALLIVQMPKQIGRLATPPRPFACRPGDLDRARGLRLFRPQPALSRLRVVPAAQGGQPLRVRRSRLRQSSLPAPRFAHPRASFP